MIECELLVIDSCLTYYFALALNTTCTLCHVVS